MIAKRVKKIPQSGIRAFFDLVLGMPEVISLGVGEPDFVTPWRIREKAITALEEGYTSYTSNKGLSALRRAICFELKKKYGLNYDPDKEILITTGGSQAIDLTLRTVLDPGDKVVVVSPHYVAYPALTELNMGKVLYLETTEKEGFKINTDRLKQVLKQKPKAIILNYPSNPTGMTYTRTELNKIWKILEKNNVLVISDEIYEDLVYEQGHTAFPALSGARSKTVLLSGFSKGYAMTGFRVGYACGPAEVIEQMTKLHSFAMICPAIMSQIAACEAFRSQGEKKEMLREYRRRRDFFVKELNRIGLSAPCPQGAFYVFASIKKYYPDSLEFAGKLLKQEKVAVVPGTAFGSPYDGYVRMSYATAFDELKEAIVRMERFVATL